MTTTTRNEAAERLISHIHTLGQGEYGWLALGDGWSALDAGKDLGEALAAERRATVERIRGRISTWLGSEGSQRGATPGEALYLLAILDEELVR